MGKLIGLFGGSFNPVHTGHILVAKSIFKQLDLDELRFIPAAQSPFKDKPQTEDHHRLAMLQLAIQPHTGFSIDPRELAKPAPSYTIDTLKNIAAEQANDQLCLLIGIDAWLDFKHWRDWQAIMHLCCLLVMTRPGYSLPELTQDWQARQVLKASAIANGKLLFMQVPASDAASSKIRKQLGNGSKTNTFLDRSVAEYIHLHRLYQ